MPQRPQIQSPRITQIGGFQGRSHIDSLPTHVAQIDVKYGGTAVETLIRDGVLPPAPSALPNGAANVKAGSIDGASGGVEEAQG